MLRIILAIFVLIILTIIWLVYFSISEGKSYHQMFYPEYYTDPFPEDKFPPINPSKYRKKVKEGYSIMKTKKLAVLGLAYNLGEEGTHKFMKRLMSLVRDWKDYQLVIYAADSSDCTFEILKSYQRGKRIILPEEQFDKTGLTRIQKMSRLRNIVKKNITLKADYVLFQDCDLASPISQDGLAHSVAYMKKYDAIFANGIANEFIFNFQFPYLGYFGYDIFAYLEDPENPNKFMTEKMILRRGEPLHSVISAFGGAALYKYSVYSKYSYDENKKYECEHVTLHKKMYKNGSRLAINPSLIIISGRQGEHNNKNYSKIRYGKKGYRYSI